MSQPNALPRLEGMTDRLLKVQVVSGLVFSAFAFLHLTNTMLGSLGPETYDGVQRTLQRGYQAPVLEVVLVVLPLLVHLVAGVIRVAKRLRAPAPVSWRARLHRYTGRFLALFIVGHVIATRLPSLMKGAFPGFDGVAFTFQWMPAYFWPYYTVLALSGWFHLVSGLSTAAGVLGLRPLAQLGRPRVFAGAVGVGAVLLVAAVFRFGLEPRDVSGGPFAQYVLEQAKAVLGTR